MWTKALMATLVIVGIALALMLVFRIGGIAPAWLLVVYAPIALVGMAMLKFVVSLFRRRRDSN